MKWWLLLSLSALACSANVEEPEPETTDTPQDQKAANPDECSAEGETAACEADGKPGTRSCEVGASGFVWGPCQVAPAQPDQCKQGDSHECFPVGSPMREQFGNLTSACRLIDGRWAYSPLDCATPLVLSFDGKPVEFTRATGAFDLFGEAMSIGTDWIGAKTPWLVLDRDQNGLINDGSELFGSMTPLPEGGRARDGFSALATLDSDRDGRITPSDPVFAELMLWSDANQDRRSDSSELRSLASAGVEALDLNHEVVPRCVPSGCELERSGFSFRAGTGEIKTGALIDVHLQAL